MIRGRKTPAEILEKVMRGMETRMSRVVYRVISPYIVKSLRRGGGKRARVSAPGQPPFAKTGNLRASIIPGSSVIRENKDTVRGRVGSFAVPYARMLELGGDVKGGQPFLIVDMARVRGHKKIGGGRTLARKDYRRMPGVNLSGGKRMVFLRRTATKFMGRTKSVKLLPRPFLMRGVKNNEAEALKILGAPGLL